MASKASIAATACTIASGAIGLGGAIASAIVKKETIATEMKKSVDTKIQPIEKRLDSLEKKVAEHDKRLDDHERRLGILESVVGEISPERMAAARAKNSSLGF